MFCGKCGAQLSEGAAFCGKCGAAQAAAGATNPHAAASGAVPPSYGAGAVGGTRAPYGGAGAPSVGASAPYGGAASPYGGASGAAAGVYGAGQPARAAKSPIVKVAVIAVAVIVVLIVVAAFAGKAGGGGAASEQEVCGKLGSSFQQLCDDKFSSESIVNTVRDMADLMPPETIDAQVKEEGYESLDEMLGDGEGELSSMFSSDYYSSLSGYFDAFDFSISCKPGDALEQSELDEVNESLARYNCEKQADKGYEIIGDMTFTATSENDYGIDVGASKTGSEEMGMYVIEIDGEWYLWADM